MIEFPLNKLHVFNYGIIALILITSLLFIRDVINISVSDKKTLAAATSDTAANTSKTSADSIMAYSQIVEKNPFGPPMVFRSLISKQRVSSRPSSPSDLMLIGTVTGPDELSYAVFKDNSLPSKNRQRVFSFGKEVFNYGTLTSIEKDSVEITQGGSSFIVPLIALTKIQHRKSGRDASNLKFVKKIDDNQYLLDQRRVQRAIANPRQIMTDARLLPNIVDGKQEGFRIMEVRPGGIYESLGLQNRDILLRINGLDLSSPEAAVQTMAALKGMKKINLDIIRNGTNMSLGYQME